MLMEVDRLSSMNFFMLLRINRKINRLHPNLPNLPNLENILLNKHQAHNFLRYKVETTI